MIDSLSIKNQLIWIFSIHVIMNIEVISSSFFNVSAIILDVFSMKLLIAFFIKTMIFAANFLTWYFEIVLRPRPQYGYATSSHLTRRSQSGKLAWQP
jgi:hypothetical protein